MLLSVKNVIGGDSFPKAYNLLSNFNQFNYLMPKNSIKFFVNNLKGNFDYLCRRKGCS